MPVFVFECEGCGAVDERFYHSWRDRPDSAECPQCKLGTMRRAMNRELFAAPGTEKKFEPYFDVGTGRYYKYRSDQQADYKAKGLTSISKNEAKRRFENTLENPVGRQPTEAQRRAKWAAAVGKAHRRIAENRRIVV